MRDNSDDYRRLFLQGIPLMDVRAPIEFAKGAFPGAVNAPLMNDSERQKVGACYKQQGQQAAVELGHQLVSGKIKVARESLESLCTSQSGRLSVLLSWWVGFTYRAPSVRCSGYTVSAGAWHLLGHATLFGVYPRKDTD